MQIDVNNTYTKRKSELLDHNVTRLERHGSVGARKA